MRVTKTTIPQLQKQGIQVVVMHDRAKKEDGSIDVKGGRTGVYLIRGDRTEVKRFMENPVGNRENVIGVGQAACSELDNFNKRRGVQIALGRALEDAKIPTLQAV